MSLFALAVLFGAWPQTSQPGRAANVAFIAAADTAVKSQQVGNGTVALPSARRVLGWSRGDFAQGLHGTGSPAPAHSPDFASAAAAAPATALLLAAARARASRRAGDCSGGEGSARFFGSGVALRGVVVAEVDVLKPQGAAAAAAAEGNLLGSRGGGGGGDSGARAPRQSAAQLDTACCLRCSASPQCDFWERPNGVGGGVGGGAGGGECVLKTGFAGYGAPPARGRPANRRGAFVGQRGSGAVLVRMPLSGGATAAAVLEQARAAAAAAAAAGGGAAAAAAAATAVLALPAGRSDCFD